MASQDGKRCGRKSDRRLVVTFLVAVLLLGATPGICGTCNVPSASYPSIQSAVDVISCTEIVLTSGDFFGGVTVGRTLEIRGVSSDTTTIVEKVTVQGSGTTATLTGLTIAVGSESLPSDGLVVVDDAEVIPDDLVIGTTDHIFFDGFESGNTTAWSATVQ
jgi:hypothetical protein